MEVRSNFWKIANYRLGCWCILRLFRGGFVGDPEILKKLILRYMLQIFWNINQDKCGSLCLDILLDKKETITSLIWYDNFWLTPFSSSLFDLFQPKTDLSSTRALIWLHFKTVHYFSQPIFSLFSYLKNALHNLVIELCSALKTFETNYGYLLKSRAFL